MIQFLSCMVFIAFGDLSVSTGLQPHSKENALKIACIGASITWGSGTSNPDTDSFPAQLGTLLGSNYQITNWGVGGTTMLKNGNAPWWGTGYFNELKNTAFDIIFIDLGGNDAKGINRAHYNELVADAVELITICKNSPGKPRVILLTPILSTVDTSSDTGAIQDSLIVNEVTPRLLQAVYQTDCEFIDMHPVMQDHKDWMPDTIHPNTRGAAIIASRLYEQVVQPRDWEFNSFPNSNFDNWHGYKRFQANVAGRAAQVIKPKVAAEGHPYAWRGRWWDVEPRADIALLERGYHMVYIDLVELYGNNESVAICATFHQFLSDAGLGPKPTLFGFSRGSVYVLQWAAVYPTQVTAVYLDNPLLDMKSFPCGLGRQPRNEVELAAFKKDYGLVTEDDLKNFHDSPIDKIPQLVAGKYPILILCADEDDEVPPEENTLPFQTAFNAAGGTCDVYHKPGFKHHPHSLPDPEYITRFLVKAAGLNYAPK